MRFPKTERNIAIHFNLLSKHLANLNGATDRVASQRNERNNFYCDHQELTQKCLCISSSLVMTFV